MKILVLCHGNINRSPLCAAVLRAEGLEDVVSAGFLPGGLRASKKTRDWAHEHGIDLEEHRSQKVTWELVADADIVIVMDGGNEKRFRAQFPNAMAKMQWLGGSERTPDPAFLPRGSQAFHDALHLNVTFSKELARRLK